VRYEHPGNWLHYQRNLRNDMYDIVFDGPHFASWRMEHLEHDMLVKLPGNLQFYLLTGADNDNPPPRRPDRQADLRLWRRPISPP
jgi:hypothetical protein